MRATPATRAALLADETISSTLTKVRHLADTVADMAGALDFVGALDVLADVEANAAILSDATDGTCWERIKANGERVRAHVRTQHSHVLLPGAVSRVADLAQSWSVGSERNSVKRRPSRAQGVRPRTRRPSRRRARTTPTTGRRLAC